MNKFKETEHSRLFFIEVRAVIKRSRLTLTAIEKRAGMCGGWLRAHLSYPRPWSAPTVTAFCTAVGLNRAESAYLHRLAARALGYLV